MIREWYVLPLLKPSIYLVTLVLKGRMCHCTKCQIRSFNTNMTIHSHSKDNIRLSRVQCQIFAGVLRIFELVLSFFYFSPHELCTSDTFTWMVVLRGIHPMLFQCWASVCDAGPTLKQHRVNASCLLDTVTFMASGW